MECGGQCALIAGAKVKLMLSVVNLDTITPPVSLFLITDAK